MMGDGSFGWWGPGLLIMGFCMVMMFWMMFGHGSHRSDSGRGASGGVSDVGAADRLGSAERVLADRFARGEIDAEEYERRLRVLRHAEEVERT